VDFTDAAATVQFTNVMATATFGEMHLTLPLDEANNYRVYLKGRIGPI